MNAFEQKQADRKQRYLDRAESAHTESDRRSNSAVARVHGMAGTPILIGHHSEKRHRRDLERSDNDMRKSIAELDKARHYEHKAEGVGKGGISSDDPEAVQKLKRKMRACELYHINMKAVNSAWRKAGKPKADNAEGWAKAAEILGKNLDNERESMRLDFIDRAPYTFELTNNGANIKRMNERLKSLEREADRETTETAHEGFSVVENAEENRIQVIFPGKPEPEVRAVLKSNGFRWAPSQSAWQRHLNNAGRYAVACVVKELA